jgi:PleD family two-component response regulator
MLGKRAASTISLMEQACWTTDDEIPSTVDARIQIEEANDRQLVGADLLNLKDSVVLVVDNKQDVRHYVATILSKFFKVVEFGDGQSALDYAVESPPSLILSDIQMPILGQYSMRFSVIKS